jgi:tetratricopeptide (TPR) repeat protein
MTSVPQLLGLALQHYRKGEWPQAEQLYRRVLDVDPNQTDALRILALVACQTGRSSMAIDYLRAALRLRPMWADAHNDLGMVFISQKRFGEAAASFREAVRLRSDFAPGHNNLGNTLRELGQAAEAAACLQEAIRLVPGYAEAHYNLGLVLAAQGKPNDALVSFQQAVGLKPHYAEAHMQIGKALGGLGQYAEAGASFQKVLRLQPNNALARSELEGALAGGHQIAVSLPPPPKASRPDVDYSKTPAEDTPATGDLVDSVGSSEQISHAPAVRDEVPADRGLDVPSPKQLDLAGTSWSETLRFESDYARLHYYLARVLERQGRSESALAHYEEVVRLEPDHEETLVRVQTMRRIRGGPEPALDRVTKSIPVRRKHDIENLPITAKRQNGRLGAPTIAKEYERWARGQNYFASRVDHPRPAVTPVGDSAALDVYFGLVDSAPGSASEYWRPEPTQESRPEQAQRNGAIQADVCAL